MCHGAAAEIATRTHLVSLLDATALIQLSSSQSVVVHADGGITGAYVCFCAGLLCCTRSVTACLAAELNESDELRELVIKSCVVPVCWSVCLMPFRAGCKGLSTHVETA